MSEGSYVTVPVRRGTGKGYLQYEQVFVPDAPPKTFGIPEGYVLVPKEPTEAMKEVGRCAGDASAHCCVDTQFFGDVYRAMINAAK